MGKERLSVTNREYLVLFHSLSMAQYGMALPGVATHRQVLHGTEQSSIKYAKVLPSSLCVRAPSKTWQSASLVELHWLAGRAQVWLS